MVSHVVAFSRSCSRLLSIVGVYQPSLPLKRASPSYKWIKGCPPLKRPQNKRLWRSCRDNPIPFYGPKCGAGEISPNSYIEPSRALGLAWKFREHRSCPGFSFKFNLFTCRIHLTTCLACFCDVRASNVIWLSFADAQMAPRSSSW